MKKYGFIEEHKKIKVIKKEKPMKNFQTNNYEILDLSSKELASFGNDIPDCVIKFDEETGEDVIFVPLVFNQQEYDECVNYPNKLEELVTKKIKEMEEEDEQKRHLN